MASRLRRKRWYYAGDLATGAQRAFGDSTHDALRAAAIDKPQVRLGERSAERVAGLE